MNLVKRSAFGWPATRASRAYPKRGLVIHYDGSDQGLAGKPHSECVAYWKRTRDFHMKIRGWVDIGYSFACCPHSSVFEGRGYGRSQAAQPGGNTTWYSCTLMSGPAERPNAAQINAVRELRQWLMGKGVAGAVRGHRDFVSTSCPGDIAYRMVQDGTFRRSPEEGIDDMDLNDKVKIGDWIKDRWPDSPGLQDGSILVSTALASGYGHARTAADNTAEILAELQAQRIAIREMAAALAAHDREIDVDALVARIEAALESVRIRVEVE